APDVLDLFLPAHRLGRTGFPFDNRGTQTIRRALVGEVAIAVEPAGFAVDANRQKDARDAAGQKLRHGEHSAAHEARRQNVEHMIILALADLEPFADVAPAANSIVVERRIAVPRA